MGLNEHKGGEKEMREGKEPEEERNDRSLRNEEKSGKTYEV
jgi:hypothetical protein